MADRPILFSAPMVRALLAGTKTQTRRIFIPPAPFAPTDDISVQVAVGSIAPRIQAGDRLWVREAVTRFDKRSCDQHIWYRAGGNPNQHARDGLRYFDLSGGPDVEWPAGVEGPGGGAAYNVSPIFMPRWASRLTLTVTDVRVQRLQDISGNDAQAEGISIGGPAVEVYRREADRNHAAARRWNAYRIRQYRDVWEAINGVGSWDANPWVAAYSFTVERRNIDAPHSQGGQPDV